MRGMRGCWFLLLFILAGCAGFEEQNDKIVRRARAYLLESGDLEPEQEYYIRFNRPVIVAAPVFPSSETDRMSLGRRQLCVMWRMPDNDTDYLVYGTDNGKLEGWSPQRVIRKKFRRLGDDLESCCKKSRSFAVTNFHDKLSVSELNSILRNYPALLETSYAPLYSPDGKVLSDEKIRKKEEDFAGSLQYSLVWPLDNGRQAVFTGYASPGLAGWKLNHADLVTAEDLRRHTLRIVRVQEDTGRNLLTAEEELPFLERKKNGAAAAPTPIPASASAENNNSPGE